ncbi:MAG: hypothetical protein U5L96_14215 [Owenweeksia sp.]|nr:hypothetical protein [Owenweeksia sp.]
MRWAMGLFLISITGGMVHGQLADAYALIEPQNDFEQEVFEGVAAGDTSYLALLMAACGEMDSAHYLAYENRLEDVYNSLDSARLAREKPKKQIKKIFEAVHSALLVKYEVENQFAEIFEKGYYNCVSATAVYSYMLSRFGIAHVVIKTPDHVYALAFIEDEEWVLESTDPAQGYYQITDKDSEAQLDELVEQKIITLQQRQSDSLDAILQKLYPSEAIDLVQLVSLQYLNQAIYDMEDQEIWSSLQNALKAVLLKPAEQQKLMLYEALHIWLDQGEYEHPKYFIAMRYFLMADTSIEHYDRLLAVYPNYGQLFLEGELNDNRFDTLTHAFSQAVKGDTARHREVHLWYNLFKAQQQVNMQEGLSAYQYSSQALALNHKSAEAMQLYQAALVLVAMSQKWSQAAILDTVRMAQNKVPDLRQSKIWNGIYGELLLNEALAALNAKEYYHARQLKQEFEALMANDDLEVFVSKSLIGGAYARLALQDFNRGKEQARQTLEQGLDYAPENSSLLRYKKMMGL